MKPVFFSKRLLLEKRKNGVTAVSKGMVDTHTENIERADLCPANHNKSNFIHVH